jgi:hypothetical protein
MYIRSIINVFNSRTARLTQVMEIGHRAVDTKFLVLCQQPSTTARPSVDQHYWIASYLSRSSIKTGHHLIEDVKVALVLLLERDASLFKKERRDLATDWSGAVIELDLPTIDASALRRTKSLASNRLLHLSYLEVFTEPRRVIIANGLGITKRLHQWITVDDDILDMLDRETTRTHTHTHTHTHTQISTQYCNRNRKQSPETLVDKFENYNRVQTSSCWDLITSNQTESVATLIVLLLHTD